jgi:hypothetical protein
MAKDTLGEKFTARKDEVPNLREVLGLVMTKVREMRNTDGLTPEDCRLCELAAKTTDDLIERAAFLVRASDLAPEVGRYIVESRKVMDDYVIEKCRVLVVDVYGLPEIGDYDDLLVDAETEAYEVLAA